MAVLEFVVSDDDFNEISSWSDYLVLRNLDAGRFQITLERRGSAAEDGPPAVLFQSEGFTDGASFWRAVRNAADIADSFEPLEVERSIPEILEVYPELGGAVMQSIQDLDDAEVGHESHHGKQQHVRGASSAETTVTPHDPAVTPYIEVLNQYISDWLGFDLPDENEEDYHRWQVLKSAVESIRTVDDAWRIAESWFGDPNEIFDGIFPALSDEEVSEWIEWRFEHSTGAVVLSCSVEDVVKRDLQRYEAVASIRYLTEVSVAEPERLGVRAISGSVVLEFSRQGDCCLAWNDRIDEKAEVTQLSDSEIDRLNSYFGSKVDTQAAAKYLENMPEGALAALCERLLREAPDDTGIAAPDTAYSLVVHSMPPVALSSKSAGAIGDTSQGVVVYWRPLVGGSKAMGKAGQWKRKLESFQNRGYVVHPVTGSICGRELDGWGVFVEGISSVEAVELINWTDFGRGLVIADDGEVTLSGRHIR